MIQIMIHETQETTPRLIPSISWGYLTRLLFLPPFLSSVAKQVPGAFTFMGRGCERLWTLERPDPWYDCDHQVRDSFSITLTPHRQPAL